MTQIDNVLRLAKEQRYLEDYTPKLPVDDEIRSERLRTVAQQVLETTPETAAGVGVLVRRAAALGLDHSDALAENLHRVAEWISRHGIRADTLAELRGWRSVTARLHALSGGEWDGGVPAMVALNSAVEGAERIAAASALSPRRRRRTA